MLLAGRLVVRSSWTGPCARGSDPRRPGRSAVSRPLELVVHVAAGSGPTRCNPATVHSLSNVNRTDARVRSQRRARGDAVRRHVEELPRELIERVVERLDRHRRPHHVAVRRVLVGAPQGVAVVEVVGELGRPPRDDQLPRISLEVDEQGVLAGRHRRVPQHQLRLGDEPGALVRPGPPHVRPVVQELAEVVGPEDVPAPPDGPAVADLDPAAADVAGPRVVGPAHLGGRPSGGARDAALLGGGWPRRHPCRHEADAGRGRQDSPESHARFHAAKDNVAAPDARIIVASELLVTGTGRPAIAGRDRGGRIGPRGRVPCPQSRQPRFGGNG